MNKTPIYGLGFVQVGDQTSQMLDMDQVRFQTIENNLYHLYTIFGNGVFDADPSTPSWILEPVPGDTSGTQILITPGQGHLAWKIATTTTNTILQLPFPPGGTYPIQYWIYATPTATTPNLESVLFIASLVQINNPDYYIGLGSVIVSFNGTNYVTTPYNDAAHGRVDISLFATLLAIINKHVHIGGAYEPSPIDLGLHVQGKLSGSHIENLDAASVTSGVFAAERIPQIDHKTLARIGVLNHNEIDSLLASLSIPTNSRLSDLFIANMLTLALSLKKQIGLSAIDANLINAILYIPGITPDSYAAYYSNFATYGLVGVTSPFVPDTIALATIDKVNHEIIGGLPNTQISDTIVWTTDTDFNTALTSDAPDTHDIFVFGSGVGASFTIDTPINYKGITNNDFTKWTFGLVLDDLGATATNNFNDDFTLNRYVFLNFSSSQDWSQDDTIGFGYGVINPSYPGDIYAYLILGTGGTNVTVTMPNGSTDLISISTLVKIYDHTTPDSAMLYNQQSLITFASRSDLAEVIGIGFCYKILESRDSTSWDDKAVDFELVVPDLSFLPPAVVQARTAPTFPILPDTTSTIFIWNTTLYAPTAQFVFRYSGGTPHPQYNVVDWSAIAPYGTLIEVDTRVGDTLLAVESGTISIVPTDTHRVNGFYNTAAYIDIIVKLTASSDLLSAPTVESIVLGLTTTGILMEKDWNTEALWDTGMAFVNVKTGDIGLGEENDLVLIDDSKVGEFVFIRNDNTMGDDAWSSYSGVDTLYADGSQLYQTPYQVWEHGASFGFENPRDMFIEANGNTVFADTLNDRVVEIDPSGNLVRAIQGNIRLRQITRDFVALSATYNPRLGTMWIAFSQNVTVSDRTKMTIACGQQSISLGDPTINIILFEPINGLSATLEVVFTGNTLATVNSWTGIVQVYIGASSVANAGNSTGGSGGGSNNSGTSGTGPGGSPGPGGNTGGGPFHGLSGPDTSTLPSFILGPPALYAYLGSGIFSASGLGSITGLPVVVAPTVLVGDFNGDSIVPTAGLLGPGGQQGSIVLTVYVGEVVFDNIYSPVSVQVTDFGLWVVATVGAASVNCYDQLGNSLWTIPTNIFTYIDGKGGSAYLMPNNNVVIAAPSPLPDNKGRVLVINQPSGNVIITNIVTDGDAVRALPDASMIQYWVLLDDIVGDGAMSRLVRIDTSGKILWNWGTGIIVHPTGLKILPNGDLLVSE